MPDNTPFSSFIVSTSAEGVYFRFTPNRPLAGGWLDRDRARALGLALIECAQVADLFQNDFLVDNNMPLIQTEVAFTPDEPPPSVHYIHKPRSESRTFGEKDLVASTLTFKHGLATHDIRWHVRDDEGESYAPIDTAVIDENTILINLGDHEMRGYEWTVKITAMLTPSGPVGVG